MKFSKKISCFFLSVLILFVTCGFVPFKSHAAGNVTALADWYSDVWKYSSSYVSLDDMSGFINEAYFNQRGYGYAYFNPDDIIVFGIYADNGTIVFIATANRDTSRCVGFYPNPSGSGVTFSIASHSPVIVWSMSTTSGRYTTLKGVQGVQVVPYFDGSGTIPDDCKYAGLGGTKTMSKCWHFTYSVSWGQNWNIVSNRNELVWDVYTKKSSNYYLWGFWEYPEPNQEIFALISQLMPDIDFYIKELNKNELAIYKQNGEIITILKNISDKLTVNFSSSSYQPTSNSSLNQFDKVQDKVIDSVGGGLSNFTMPSLDSYKNGNSSNAFKFISSCIEFFSGNSLSENNNALRKVSTVIFIVLSFGLVGFVLNISTKRKE